MIPPTRCLPVRLSAHNATRDDWGCASDPLYFRSDCWATRRRASSDGSPAMRRREALRSVRVGRARRVDRGIPCNRVSIARCKKERRQSRAHLRARVWTSRGAVRTPCTAENRPGRQLFQKPAKVKEPAKGSNIPSDGLIRAPYACVYAYVPHPYRLRTSPAYRTRRGHSTVPKKWNPYDFTRPPNWPIFVLFGGGCPPTTATASRQVIQWRQPISPGTQCRCRRAKTLFVPVLRPGGLL